MRLLAFLPLLACTGAPIPVDSGPVGRECGEGLWGESFTAMEDRECGLGPDGPVMCRWTLTFGDETYTWSYSDIGESGTVTCVDGALSGTSAGGAPRSGAFHRTTARVNWEGLTYERSSE